MRSVAVSLLCIAIGITLSANEAPSAQATATAAEFGEDWPLKVESVVLHCEDDVRWFTAPDGATYALSGNARAKHQSLSDKIWKQASYAIPQLRDFSYMSATPLVDAAQALCD